jgi:hypothetical protein
MKKNKLLICLNSVAAVFIIVGLVAAALISKPFFEQEAAERFGEGYEQLTVFYNADTGISQDDFYSKNADVMKKLVEGSLSENILYAASSLQTDAEINTNEKKVSVAATLTAGDYFSFHPYKLLSGNYYDSETVSPNVVILDEAAAWELFGAFDVAGKFVYIGGNIYEIYGVIEKPDDRFTKDVYGTKPRAFINLAAAQNVIPGFDSKTKVINIIEYVLPNPVKSTAEGILKEVFDVDEFTIDKEIEINTDRFGAARIIPKIIKITKLGVRDKPLVYPFYENAAIVAETEITLIFAGILFFALIPLVTVIILIRRLVKKRKELFKKAVSSIKNIARNIKRDKKPNKKIKSEEII